MPQIVERYGMLELTFTSAYPYQSEQKDVVIECLFLSPTDEAETVLGYWDGGTTYRVRFSPRETGNWKWTTKCNDTLNIGLHGHSGSFEVVPSVRSTEFAMHGWPVTHMGSRTMTLADGTPWFYMSDVAWEITCNSTYNQVKQYVSRLKSCGFNAVQMCSLSHLHIGYHGVSSHNGSAFIDTNAFRPDPNYYQYLDSIVQCMNDSGIVPVIAPLWGYFTVVQGIPNTARLLTHEEAVELARYIGARYAGYNVIWIVAGDSPYDTQERRDFWSDFAHMLHRAGGRRHMTTIHTHGYSASFTYFDPSTDWLDFHMLQSSHAVDTDAPWLFPVMSLKLNPVKPLVNGELCFEDLFTYFWTEDTVCTTCFRLRPEHVRAASWHSILSGANMGISHGANGVWQWYTGTSWPQLWPRFTVENSWTMSSYDDMATLKLLLTELQWYKIIPRPDLLMSFSGEEYTHVSVAQIDSSLIAYVHKGVHLVEILPEMLRSCISLSWINPRTGASFLSNNRVIHSPDYTVIVSPPDTNDWLLLLKNAVVSTDNTLEALPAFNIAGVSWLSSKTAVFRIECAQRGNAYLNIYDILGRCADRVSCTVQPGSNSISVSLAAGGMYFYHITYISCNGEEYATTGKLMKQ